MLVILLCLIVSGCHYDKENNKRNNDMIKQKEPTKQEEQAETTENIIITLTFEDFNGI